MDRDNEALGRRIAEQAAASGQSQESSDEDDTYVVREGVTRAIDPDEIELRRQRGLTEDDNAARVHGDIAGFDPDRELARPPDFPESLDVATVAPDGTTVPGRTSQLTDPLTGEAIGGGRSVSDSVKAGLGELGGDALNRGLDYDPLTPGTQDSRPGGRETTGDPSVDRAISAHDGSQFGMGVEFGEIVDVTPKPLKVEFGEIVDVTPKPMEVEFGEIVDVTPKPSPEGSGGPPGASKMENPDADSGDNVTNLERVTVMQGSQVRPSNNPDDPATGDASTDNWIPPADLVSTPAQEGEATATTLTSAASLGSSPLTNPTDPVLGDDGIIAGGTYGGSGGSGGGGEIMPTGMSAGDASALGGEGEANLPIGGGGEASALGGAGDANLPIGGGGEASALGGAGDVNLPITVEPAPAGGGSADALAAGDSGMKMDANNVSVDMATGQVVGGAAPAIGGELTSHGAMLAEGEDAALAMGSSDATSGGDSFGVPAEGEAAPPVGEEGGPPTPPGDDG